MTRNKAIGILKEAYELCAKILYGKVNEAYLYGSYARKDFTDQSDVDILLTASLTRTEISNLRQEIAVISSDLSLKYDVTISITVKSHDEFLQHKEILPFYQNVIKDGIKFPWSKIWLFGKNFRKYFFSSVDIRCKMVYNNSARCRHLGTILFIVQPMTFDARLGECQKEGLFRLMFIQFLNRFVRKKSILNWILKNGNSHSCHFYLKV